MKHIPFHHARHYGIALALVLTGCQSAPALVQDAQTALNGYQAALGVADVALASNPSLVATINTDAAKAAPFVAAAQAGVTDASTAPNLGVLANDLLAIGAPYITAIPNGAAAK